MKAMFALGLSEAAEKIARGEITSEALTASCIRRIAAVEPQVHAWEWIDDTRALRIARRADERRLAGCAKGSAAAADVLPLPERGTLSGIPIGVKDIVETAGISTGMGSSVYHDYVPRSDARLLDRLAASGAFVLGKTVTTEFAFLVPGKTRNPWNPAHSPGGSSSGSAAAVASGMVPGAIGTQTNGSVIRPAAYCGVVGFKPDRGLVSAEGVLSFSATLDQPGVFARSVADAGLLASWLTQADGRIGRQIPVLRSAPNVIALNSPVWHKADPTMRQRFAADLATVRAGGATVTERELPPAFDDGYRAHRVIMLYEAARASQAVRRQHGLHFSRFLREALEEGDGIADEDYRRALALRELLIESLGEFLEDRYEAILTPPATGEAPTPESTGDPAFCTLWSLCGVPAITIPTGFGPQRLPLGLQIVGRAGESNHLLAVAAWCEARMGFKGMLARI